MFHCRFGPRRTRSSTAIISLAGRLGRSYGKRVEAGRLCLLKTKSQVPTLHRFMLAFACLWRACCEIASCANDIAKQDSQETLLGTTMKTITMMVPVPMPMPMRDMYVVYTTTSEAVTPQKRFVGIFTGAPIMGTAVYTLCRWSTSQCIFS